MVHLKYLLVIKIKVSGSNHRVTQAGGPKRLFSIQNSETYFCEVIKLRLKNDDLCTYKRICNVLAKKYSFDTKYDDYN